MADSIENPSATPVSAGLRGLTPALLAAVGTLCVLVAFRHVFEIGAERPRTLEGAEGLVFDPVGSSPPLIFAGALWLLARRWRRLERTLGAGASPFLGSSLLVLGAVACAWGYYAYVPTLVVVALSAWMMGTALWLGGTRAGRAILLPACFVLLAIPVPIALVNGFMHPLQLATAEAAGELMRWAGLDVRYEADMLAHRGALFQVIESCSGVRTVVTMLMTVLLFHDLFFRSRLQSVILFVMAPVIGMISNTLRVMLIVLNPYSKFAAIHTAQGLVMIVVAVLMLALLDALLTRVLPPDPPLRRPRATAPLPLGRIAAMVAVTAALATSTLLIRPWQPPTQMGEALGTFPARLGPYQTQGLPLDREYLGSVGFSEWVHRRYSIEGEDEAASIELLLGADHRLYEHTNFQSDKTALPGPGYQIVERGPATIGGVEVERMIVAGRGKRRLVFERRWGVASFGTELVRSVLALDRGPWRRPGRALVLRIDTEIAPGGLTAAEERLTRFWELVTPPFEKLAASGS